MYMSHQLKDLLKEKSGNTSKGVFMIDEMLKRKVLSLLKYFDECCNHWYDHEHYLKLHEINPDTAFEYERSIYDFTVYLYFDPKPKFYIRCHSYLKHLGLYQCDNKFEKTIAYINSKLNKKDKFVMDYNLLNIFDLPEIN